MPTNATCSRCGHRLAESNTTGTCYRTCEITARGQALKPTEIRPGIKEELLLSILCKHFNMTVEQILDADREHRFGYQRALAYYLLKHELGMDNGAVRRLMSRPKTDIKTSVEMLMRNFDSCRPVIEAVRNKYYEKLELSDSKIST